VTTTEGKTRTAATDATQPPRLRASDVDRLATVLVLQDAVARGLLTPDEGSDRMAAAFAAVHVAELPPLTADLPSGQATHTPPGWRPLATMAAEQVRASLHDTPSGRLNPARVAFAVLIAVILVLLFGAMVGAFFGGGDFHGGGHHHGGFGDD
jgi:hypothetical protein